MKPIKARRYPRPLQVRSVQVFQISGITLITLGLLNSLFLKSIGVVANGMLFLCGLGQLWISYRLWLLFRRLSRPRSVRFKKSGERSLTPKPI